MAKDSHSTQTGSERWPESQARADSGHDDLPENPERTGTVDPGGIQKLIRKRFHVLPEKENAIGVHNAGQIRAWYVLMSLILENNQKVGIRVVYQWQEHGPNHQPEEDILTRKLNLAKP